MPMTHKGELSRAACRRTTRSKISLLTGSISRRANVAAGRLRPTQPRDGGRLLRAEKCAGRLIPCRFTRGGFPDGLHLMAVKRDLTGALALAAQRDGPLIGQRLNQDERRCSCQLRVRRDGSRDLTGIKRR